jgi:hypothetical protein
MSVPPAWPHVLDFFGTPLVIEPSPGQLSTDAVAERPAADDRVRAHPRFSLRRPSGTFSVRRRERIDATGRPVSTFAASFSRSDRTTAFSASVQGRPAAAGHRIE